jgi:phosphohistidine phosphatase
MNLFLVRHAKAETANGSKSDTERELTPEGITILKNSVEVWEKYFNEIDFIISSPILRAVQTAELIKSQTDFSGKIFKENLMLPGADGKDMIHIFKIHKAENMILVGHQPDLSNAISSFTGCEIFEVPFKPASVAKISFSGKPAVGRGVLEFLIPPVLK